MTHLWNASAPTDSARARAALAYARHGWPVLPCMPRRKVPLTPDGFHGASADVETVTGWWRAEPEANVGLVPARAALADGSTLLVLDCDGPAGHESAAALGAPSDTARVATGRRDGGEHRYYSVPAGVRVGNCTPAPGLDVRHAAGYVLVPPSVHPSGAAYRWHSAPAWAPGAVLPLPAALLEHLTRAPQIASPSTQQERVTLPLLGAAGASDAPTWRRLARYLTKVPTGLSDGRKTLAYRLAAALVHDFALGAADAWAVLAAWNSDNEPPLSARALHGLLRNATRYGKGAGRGLPRRSA